MKIRNKSLLALSFVMLLGCTVDDSPISGDDGSAYMVPMEDVANNYCVYEKKVKDGCDLDNNYNYWDSDAKTAMNYQIARFSTGADGLHFKVLSSDYSMGRYCSEGGYNSYEYYIAHECDGIAIDSSTYGPYPFNALESKKVNLTAELESQGYEVLYVETNNGGGSLYYLTFYIYSPNPSNAKQSAIVDTIKTLKKGLEFTGLNTGRPLLEVTKDLSKIAFTDSQKLILRKLNAYLKVIENKKVFKQRR